MEAWDPLNSMVANATIIAHAIRCHQLSIHRRAFDKIVSIPHNP